MKLSPSIRILVMLAVTLSAIGCATGNAPAPDRSALETAQLAYANGSLAYEVTMLTIADLDAAGLLKPEWRSRVLNAQSQVQLWAPKVNDALNLWQQLGTKPDAYDQANAKLAAAYAEATAVKGLVQP